MSRVPRDISNLPFESRKRTKTVTSDGGQSKDLSIDCSQSSVGISQDSTWCTSPTTSLNSKSKSKSKATLHSNGDSFNNSNDSDSHSYSNFDSDVDTDSNEYTSRSGRRHRRRRKHKRSKRNGNLIYTSTSKRSSYHSSNESSSSEYSSSSESSYYSLVRQKPSSDSDTDSSYYSLIHRKPSRSKAKHSVKSDFNVASLPQLENKNAKSSKKEEIDLKLFDFSDEKPSPPRKLSVSSSSSEGSNQQKTDALVEATSASAITLPKEKKKTFEIPVPGKEGAIPNALNGKIFVLTGVFPELRGGAGLTRGKNECITMIESFGGVVRSCISGKTNYLVVGKEPGPSKYNQAKVKGLPMLDLRELCRLMFGETTLEASSSGSISMSSGSLSSVVGKSVVIDRGASGSGDGGSMIVSSGASNASGNGGSMTLLSGSNNKKPSQPRELSVSSSSSDGVAGSTNSGGLTLPSGSTLNGMSGAIDAVSDQDIKSLLEIAVGCADLDIQTHRDMYDVVRGILQVKVKGERKALIKNCLFDLVNQDSDDDDDDDDDDEGDDENQTAFEPIPCTKKADPQGYAEVKDIVSSMVQKGEWPCVKSVVKQCPNLERKYKRRSLDNTIKRFRNEFQPETNDEAGLENENESDGNEDDSVQKLIESCRSNGFSKGFNIQSNLSNAVPKEINIAVLLWVRDNGVYKPCMGLAKEALQRQIVAIAEKVGYDLSGNILNKFVENRLCWARSVSGLHNTYVGPKQRARYEKQRKEDQQLIDFYLTLHDNELLNLRVPEEAMKKEVEKFVNRYIEDFGMTFDQAVKSSLIRLTWYGGITGTVGTNAVTEAFRWMRSPTTSNPNPVLVNADGTGIGKKRAEEKYGFKVMWDIYESVCFDNVALFEKLLHLKYHHLQLGRERCWRIAGWGMRSSVVRGHYKVFITYSTKVQAAIDAGKINIVD
ncbi:hypothetical protein CTEN210_04396 [Chaetoceros tenuissimus]|uniref:BRCT domain-containing protein n=1 Tax=Chaetoceros tenuissimus TaxID=426638 RepID=A0AAD3CMR5_9STRA|nr:hypothetical protein CTEN210_04396 [Chaetoceros tenuissimus]